MKKNEKGILTSKKHPKKILKPRRVRFNLPVKEKDVCSSSSGSLPQDTLKEFNCHPQKMESFVSPASVEESLPMTEMKRGRQESVALPTNRQQEPECSLVNPAIETETCHLPHTPVLSNATEELRGSAQSLLNVEKEIVQILAEMQMKRSGYTLGGNEKTQEKILYPQKTGHYGTVPAAVNTSNAFVDSNLQATMNHLNDDGPGPMITGISNGNVEDNREEVVITNQLRDDDSGCSKNVGAADSDIKEDIKAIVATDEVKDVALGASQICVQLALKVVMKEEGPSVVLLSQPHMDETSRNMLNLKQGKLLPDDVQIIETKMQAGGNSQVSVCISLEHEKCTVKQEKKDECNGDTGERYPGYPTFADNNCSIKESSDDVQVVYESKRINSISSGIKSEKNAVQRMEAAHFNGSGRDVYPSNWTIADDNSCKIEENSNDLQIIYESQSIESISSGIKSEKNAVQHVEAAHFNVGERDEVSMNLVQYQESIKQEEERSFNMDTCVSVTSFPPDVDTATQNNIGDGEPHDDSENETGCLVCAWFASKSNAVNQDKAEYMNDSDCQNVINASNNYTEVDQELIAALGIVKQEELVSSVINHSEDVKEETKEDLGIVTDDLGLASPVLDCGISTVQLKKEDSIDIDENFLISDYTTDNSSVKTSTDISQEETFLFDQDEGNETLQGWPGWEVTEEDIFEDTDRWESECPPEILDESVESVPHTRLLNNTLASNEDSSFQCGVQRTVERHPASNEDNSVEFSPHAEQVRSSPATKDDNSIEFSPHAEQVRSSPATKDDNSIESRLPSRKLKSPLVSIGDNSVLSHYVPESQNPKRVLVVKLRRSEVTDYYKGIESPVPDKMSTNLRNAGKNHQQEVDSCIVPPQEDCTYHIPGNANQDHIKFLPDSLENITEDSNKEGCISSGNHERVDGDTASQYNCNSCSNVFSSKYNLIKHVFMHIGMEAPVHICKVCGKIFNSAFELQRHNMKSCLVMLHKIPTNFSDQTHKSNYENSFNSSLTENVNMDNEFVCNSCSQVFTSKYSLTRHVFNHIDGAHAPSHICKLCGKVLCASWSLRRHYKFGCKKSYRKGRCLIGNNLQEGTHLDSRNLKEDAVVKQKAVKVKCAFNTNSREFPSKRVHDYVGSEDTNSHICSVCGEICSTAAKLRKHYSKICNRIEDSIQYINKMQKRTQEERINNSLYMSEKVVGKTTHCEVKCSSCPEVSSSEERLTKHEFTTSYNCPQCGKIFNTQFHLDMHISRKEQCTAVDERDTVVALSDIVKALPQVQNVPQQSDTSDSLAQSSQSSLQNIRVKYRKSEKTGLREKVCLCDFCDKPFRKLSSLITHRRTHTGERNYICNICNKSFAVQGNLNRHLQTHSGEYPHSCNICNKSFKQKGHLQRHRVIHSGERPHKCHICGKRFKQSGSLQNHQVVHTGERPYQCEVCGRTFSLRGNLRQHSYTHAKQYPYQCDKCCKAFSKSTTLKKHSCILPDETRQFKCTFCCMYFHRYCILKKHLSTHLGIRPFKCKVCGKSFLESGSLKVHQYIHTGERPYKCDECGRSFTQRGTLKRHLRVHNKT